MDAALDVAGRAALAAAGVVHLLPLPGVLGARRLRALYGLRGVDADADLTLLLRHRAVLFGLLGAGMVGAAALGGPQAQAAAVAAGAVSAGTFNALAHGVPLNAQLRRVVAADWVALACLAAAGGSLALAWRGA
jgi:hypothetical protein